MEIEIDVLIWKTKVDAILGETKSEMNFEYFSNCSDNLSMTNVVGKALLGAQ